MSSLLIPQEVRLVVIACFMARNVPEVLEALLARPETWDAVLSASALGSAAGLLIAIVAAHREGEPPPPEAVGARKGGPRA